MGMIVGGPRSYKRRRHGQLLWALHWVNGEGSMVIANTAMPKTPAIVIPMKMAYSYVDSRSGDPTPYCAAMCLQYAEMLGMLKLDAHRLMKIIVESIPDLLEMPPEPDWAAVETEKALGKTIGDITIKAEGKVVHEAPLRVQ